MAETRIDPNDGGAYTYAELQAYYKGKKKKAMDSYWEKKCTPVRKVEEAVIDPAPQAAEEPPLEAGPADVAASEKDPAAANGDVGGTDGAAESAKLESDHPATPPIASEDVRPKREEEPPLVTAPAAAASGDVGGTEGAGLAASEGENEDHAQPPAALESEQARGLVPAQEAAGSGEASGDAHEVEAGPSTGEPTEATGRGGVAEAAPAEAAHAGSGEPDDVPEQAVTGGGTLSPSITPRQAAGMEEEADSADIDEPELDPSVKGVVGLYKAEGDRPLLQEEGCHTEVCLWLKADGQFWHQRHSFEERDSGGAEAAGRSWASVEGLGSWQANPNGDSATLVLELQFSEWRWSCNSRSLPAEIDAAEKGSSVVPLVVMRAPSQAVPNSSVALELVSTEVVHEVLLALGVNSRYLWKGVHFGSDAAAAGS